MDLCCRNQLDNFLQWFAGGYATEVDGFFRKVILITY